MIQRLFVYGTLKPGHENAHMLEEIGGSWQAGSVMGTLVSEGWAATKGYTALVLDEKGQEVSGYVFSSELLAQHWERLDEFENARYRSVSAETKTSTRKTLSAHTSTSLKTPDLSHSSARHLAAFALAMISLSVRFFASPHGIL
jgi:gamma-glutamylcyclotransferase (GGCT)/AIG2-like uncharacterized protein YtfP